MAIDSESDAVKLAVYEELCCQREDKQRLCPHIKAATFLRNGDLACDDCGKPLTEADAQESGGVEELSAMEDEYVGINRDWGGG